MPGGDRLLPVAESVADGTPLDWAALRATAEPADLEQLDALRAVSVLAGIHRSLTAVDDLAQTTSNSRPAAGVESELGGFLLMERLGAGSQGQVYRAFDTRLERDVALKLRRLPGPGVDLAHVLREGRLLAKVRHKHIVTVYGIEVVGDHVGISMELVAGETLDAVVRREGPMSPAMAARIALDLSDAVAAVHDAGLIHRDIKAQNVILERGGRVVLMDFGTGMLQRDAGSGDRGGTPLYLAPELMQGGPASVSSDIYAIGILLYLLLTGRFPFEARTLDQLRGQLARPARPVREARAGLPPELARVVDRCLEQDPGARFPSARALGVALTPLVEPGGPSPAQGPRQQRASLGTLRRITIAALAVGLLSAGFVMRNRAVPAPSPVVAVQAFHDLSGADAAARMADGLSDSLAAELGRIKSLRVVMGRAVRDADRAGRLSDVVQQAGVTVLIGGTVDLSETQASVHVRAIDALSQTQLWETRLQGSRESLLRLQDEAVREIARRLDLELTAAHRALVSRRQSISPEALDAYYRGLAEGWRLTRTGHEEAERSLRRAVALAPEYAPARSALAYAIFTLGSSYRVLTPEQAHAEALSEANLAVALDPSWAHGHAVLGLLAFTVDWDWARAEKHFLDAIDANPSDANVRALYAQLLMLQNRLGAALAESRLALRLDPLTANRRSAVSAALYYARRTQEAIDELEALQRDDPNSSVAHFGLARYYSAAGRFDDALRQLDTAPYRDEAPPKAEYARILAAAGRLDEARDRLPALIESYQRGALAPDYLAYVHLALGDRAQALSLLEEAVQRRSPSVVWAHVDPRFDGLRLEPEFRTLMNRLGFAQ